MNPVIDAGLRGDDEIKLCFDEIELGFELRFGSASESPCFALKLFFLALLGGDNLLSSRTLL